MWVSLTGTRTEDMQQESESLSANADLSWKVGYRVGECQLSRTVKADLRESLSGSVRVRLPGDAGLGCLTRIWILPDQLDS